MADYTEHNAKAVGTSRMQVKFNPTADEIRAIPIGSDMAVINGGHIRAGVLSGEIREHLAHMTEHGMSPELVWVPPQPHPDDVPSNEDLQARIISEFEGAVSAVESGERPMAALVRTLVAYTIESAREGMYPTPW